MTTSETPPWSSPDETGCDLLGGYVLNAVDHHERRGFHDHLTRCGQCADREPSLREMAARLALLVSTSPPVLLRRHVAERTATRLAADLR